MHKTIFGLAMGIALQITACLLFMSCKLAADASQVKFSRNQPKFIREVDSSETQLIQSFYKDPAIKDRLKEAMKVFTASEHPFGSKRLRFLSEYLEKQLRQQGAFLIHHTFTAKVPDRQYFSQYKKTHQGVGGLLLTNTRMVEGINVLAKVPGKLDCSVMFGSHYDTKILDGAPYLGANDSGSSSVALLEMARFIKHYGEQSKTPLCDYLFVWFDGEESVLSDWYDGRDYFGIQDNTYGSRKLAGELVESSEAGFLKLPASLDPEASPLRAVIILDMIGSPGMLITQEKNSTWLLKKVLIDGLEELKLLSRLSGSRMAIVDDHIPFLERHVRSLNIIDFSNMAHWHKPTDVEENIDYQSIVDASMAALYVGLSLSVVR